MNLPPRQSGGVGLMAATSKASKPGRPFAGVGRDTWARIGGASITPTTTGPIMAMAPARMRAVFRAKLSRAPMFLHMISSILFLRFAPVAPDTQGSGDSKYKLANLENAFRVCLFYRR